jgi:hypothetical protein
MMVKSFVLSALALVLSSPVVAADSAHSGTWRIDAKRSSFSNMPFPQNMSLTLKIRIADGRITYGSVNDTNRDKPYLSNFATALDGTPSAFAEQERFDQVAVLQLNPDEFRVLKTKAGDVIVGEYWTFMPDGKTLRRRGVGKNAEGRSRAFEEFFTRVE